MSDPTTGGVFASYAVLGDVNLAEPNALIGFAGARVAAGTIAQELPSGFQRAEFLHEHGFIDRIVHRSELRDELATLLRYLVPASIAVPGEATDALNLPAFRPLSFLSALAERVIPEDDELDGHRPRPAASAFVPPVLAPPTPDPATNGRPTAQTAQPAPDAAPAGGAGSSTEDESPAPSGDETPTEPVEPSRG
jgi:hypothetical protein